MYIDARRKEQDKFITDIYRLATILENYIRPYR